MKEVIIKIMNENIYFKWYVIFIHYIHINYLSSPSFMMVVTFFSYKYIIIIIFTPPFFYHHGRRRYSFYLPRYLSFIVSSCDCDDYINFLKYIIIITIIFIFFSTTTNHIYYFYYSHDWLKYFVIIIFFQFKNKALKIQISFRLFVTLSNKDYYFRLIYFL